MAATVMEAWYPLGHGNSALLNEPLFAQLARKYGRTNAQIILRWRIQEGAVIFPKSTNPQHSRDNFNIFNFELTGDEMAQIRALDCGKRYYTATLDTLKVSLWVNLTIAVVGMLVFLLFPRQLLMMFSASEDMMSIGIPALRIIAAALVLTTTTQILSGFLQALGQGTASFIIAIGQAVFLLSLTGQTALVWLSFPIMELLRFVLAGFFVSRTYTGKLAVLRPQAA